MDTPAASVFEIAEAASGGAPSSAEALMQQGAPAAAASAAVEAGAKYVPSPMDYSLLIPQLIGMAFLAVCLVYYQFVLAPSAQVQPPPPPPTPPPPPHTHKTQSRERERERERFSLQLGFFLDFAIWRHRDSPYTHH